MNQTVAARTTRGTKIVRETLDARECLGGKVEATSRTHQKDLVPISQHSNAKFQAQTVDPNTRILACQENPWLAGSRAAQELDR
jgi:hypothetical protein